MTTTDLLKQRVAEHAVGYIRSHTVVGLGTGSTMRFALEELARRLNAGELSDVVGIPTSQRTADIAHDLGIPLTTLEENPKLDLAIDGADEIDPDLNAIKGGGGALLREKIVASAAREFIIIADHTKLVTQLGARFKLPVEVTPFGTPLIRRRLEAMGGSVELRLAANGQPYQTDNSNQILDCACGPIADLVALNQTLLNMPGVVDHGLFLGMARRAIIADETAIKILER